jgi:hypothetical protein
MNKYFPFYSYKGAVCLLGALSSLCSSVWHNTAGKEEKASSFVDLKESRFLSGSAFLTGSFNVVAEADSKHYHQNDSRKFAREVATGYNSVESLFLYKHPQQDDVDYHAIERTLTQPEDGVNQRSADDHSQKQREHLPLQTEEVRLLHTDSDS